MEGALGELLKVHPARKSQSTGVKGYERLLSEDLYRD
jgi:hypothetical protein